MTASATFAPHQSCGGNETRNLSIIKDIKTIEVEDVEVKPAGDTLQRHTHTHTDTQAHTQYTHVLTGTTTPKQSKTEHEMRESSQIAANVCNYLQSTKSRLSSQAQRIVLGDLLQFCEEHGRNLPMQTADMAAVVPCDKYYKTPISFDPAAFVAENCVISPL